MIKAKAGNALIFGLSEDNIQRLKKGQPLVISGKEMGLEGDILIFYGATTGDLIETIQPYLGKDTKIHDRLD